MKIGVVIGRFQVPELHAGHLALLHAVRELSDRVIVLVGMSRVDCRTSENPLSYWQRETVIVSALSEYFREFTVLPLHDQRDDKDWQERLDRELSLLFPTDDVTLYHGRQSGFISAYHGKFPVVSLEHEMNATDSGRAIRAAIEEQDTTEFMRGQIFALHTQFPKAYPTVDIALIHREVEVTSILLIQRADTGVWCLPGGFVDPTDHSLEHAAARELWEETSLVSEVPFKYVCSMHINDWRYRGSRDQIMTTLFLGRHAFGAPVIQPSEVRAAGWFPFDEAGEVIAANHAPLLLCVRGMLLKESDGQ